MGSVAQADAIAAALAERDIVGRHIRQEDTASRARRERGLAGVADLRGAVEEARAVS
jgi:hypothetical protein